MVDINVASFANRYVPVSIDLTDSYHIVILIMAVLNLFFHQLVRLNNYGTSQRRISTIYNYNHFGYVVQRSTTVDPLLILRLLH